VRARTYPVPLLVLLPERLRCRQAHDHAVCLGCAAGTEAGA
jgi:hypothetical protein